MARVDLAVLPADPPALARCALEALVEAEQLAAASPSDPVLREIVDDLATLFLTAFRAVLRAARGRS